MEDTNNKYNFLDYTGLSLFWSKIKNIIEDNELVTATALTNLDTRVDTIEDALSNQIISITYTDLKALRDDAQLVPGQQYRITDYTCTTKQENTKSAGHVFDIIVTADDESTLNEVARAVKHDGDEYFANSNLSAWKLWYCLDNDTTRFKWADETNGKGVIYRMIDEFNNDIPYDFKNIQFKHPNDDKSHPYYYYTFASDYYVENNTDCSIGSLDMANRCYSNTIREYVTSNVRQLNCITFRGYMCHSNSFGTGCHSNSFDSSCSNNSFDTDCYHNSFKDSCSNNTFDASCSNNSFGTSCSNNSFGSSCSNNTFSAYCSNNSFGSNCNNNSFGYYCSNNSFGNSCSFIEFLGTFYMYGAMFCCCSGNNFGNNCNKIQFKNTSESDSWVLNYNFAQGLMPSKGDGGYIVINAEANRKFETRVERDSNGNLKEFCLADFIYDENDNSYYYSTSFIGEI